MKESRGLVPNHDFVLLDIYADKSKSQQHGSKRNHENVPVFVECSFELLELELSEFFYHITYDKNVI